MYLPRSTAGVCVCVCVCVCVYKDRMTLLYYIVIFNFVDVSSYTTFLRKTNKI